jgi:hypothetical protein
MTVRFCLAVAALLLGAAGLDAQTLNLKLESGRVTLDAQDVPLRDILQQWAKIGGTTVLNAEKIPGGPVSFQFVDVPERAALETVLRGVSGYILAERQITAATASTFDRILILPVSTPPRNPVPTPAPVQGAAQRPAQVPPAAMIRPGGFAGARAPGAQVQGGIDETGQQPEAGAGAAPGIFAAEPGQFAPEQGLPPAMPQALPTPGAPPGRVIRPEPIAGPPPTPNNPAAANRPVPPVTVSPGNPFGVPAGSGQPGVVTPVPPPPAVTSPSETLEAEGQR